MKDENNNKKKWNDASDEFELVMFIRAFCVIFTIAFIAIIGIRIINYGIRDILIPYFMIGFILFLVLSIYFIFIIKI